jgi:superfamily I DNA/RNA helicase
LLLPLLQSFWEMPEVLNFIKTINNISKNKKIKIKDINENSRLSKDLYFLSKELEGLPLRNCANAVANKIYERMPKNLEKDRKEAWLSNTEAVLNIALDIDDIDKFLEMSDQKINKQYSIKKESLVTISTIHAAKGLEWDLVFLIGNEEENLPHFKMQNIEEERRLFYVALTRAKQNFIGTYVYNRRNKTKKPSRFLWETISGLNKDIENFQWKDPNQRKNIENNMEEHHLSKKQESQKEEKPFKRNGRRRTYKHKGGKSLIPPTERNQ